MADEFEERAQYRRIFEDMDEERRGIIATKDVVGLFHKMGKDVTAHYLQNLLEQANGKQRQNSVDFDEFVFLVTQVDKAFIQEEEMLLVFQHFDKDGDGFISPEELKDLLHGMGDEITDDDLSEMIAEADKDGDGKVSYDEFVGVMSAADNSQGGTVSRKTSSSLEEASSETDTSGFDDEGLVFEVSPSEEEAMTPENLPCDLSPTGKTFKEQTKRRQSCFVFSTSSSADMLGRLGFSAKGDQRPRSRSSCGSLASFDKERASGSTTPKKRLSLSASASFVKGLFKKKGRRRT